MICTQSRNIYQTVHITLLTKGGLFACRSQFLRPTMSAVNTFSPREPRSLFQHSILNSPDLLNECVLV